jgi:hypothetical protein
LTAFLKVQFRQYDSGSGGNRFFEKQAYCFQNRKQKWKLTMAGDSTVGSFIPCKGDKCVG